MYGRNGCWLTVLSGFGLKRVQIFIWHWHPGIGYFANEEFVAPLKCLPKWKLIQPLAVVIYYELDELMRPKAESTITS